MSKKSKREKAKRKMVSAREWAEKSGSFESTAFRIPEGMSLFSPKKEGTYKLDIIPYTTGKGNGRAPEGSTYFERTYFVHRGVGANESSYVCLQKTFGKKCPICEERAKLDKRGEDDEVVKAMLPKQRQLFNIFDHDDPDKGVQLWEISYHNFGKHLSKKIRGADEEDREKYELFYDPENGCTLRLGASEETMGKGKPFLVFSDIEFKDRKKELDEALLDEAACLDELVIKMDYDELKEILLQGGDEDDDEDDDDEDDEEPKRKKRRHSKDDEDDEDEEEEDSDEEDDEDAEGDDEDDDDSDDDSDDDEDDDHEVGDKVDFVYKGKRRTGKIKRLNKKRNLAEIQVPGQERLSVVAIDELMEVAKKKGSKHGDEEDDEDESDDEEEWEGSEDEDDESDDADDRSSRKRRNDGRKRRHSDDDAEEDEDEDDEDSDEDEEDEPKPRKKRRR